MLRAISLWKQIINTPTVLCGQETGGSLTSRLRAILKTVQRSKTTGCRSRKPGDIAFLHYLGGEVSFSTDQCSRSWISLPLRACDRMVYLMNPQGLKIGSSHRTVS